MDRYKALLIAVVIILGIVYVAAPDLGGALLMIIFPSAIALIFFRHYADDKSFVTNTFLWALVVRLAFGLFIHAFDLREFFGGDALTYDYRGNLLLAHWTGQIGALDPYTLRALSPSSAGWGMYYLVAAIYFITGHSILAAQSFCAVVGAATAPMVYFCSEKIFQNVRVAKRAALLVAFFPAFIIWSGQLLKDGLIVFLLVLAMTIVMQLQRRFHYFALLILVLDLAAILSLRFYIFFMAVVAIVGSLAVGLSSSTGSFGRRTAAIALLGIGLTYFGITRTATSNLETFSNLDRLQNSRLDLARSADSGFAEDIDVSSPVGALSAIPLGFVYLMFAPFPWQAASLRAAMTLPEVFVWWVMMVFMAAGIWWSIKHRLRNAFPILIFSLLLTLSYSIFLGNIGTAYRQRTQIQVFLFIFVAVGWQLYKERAADRKLIAHEKRRRFEHALQARAGQR